MLSVDGDSDLPCQEVDLKSPVPVMHQSVGHCVTYIPVGGADAEFGCDAGRHGHIIWDLKIGQRVFCGTWTKLESSHSNSNDGDNSKHKEFSVEHEQNWKVPILIVTMVMIQNTKSFLWNMNKTGKFPI